MDIKGYNKKEQKSYRKVLAKSIELQRQMGYSDKMLYDYGVVDYDLMNFDGISQYAKTFNLRKSDIKTIVKVITESAAYQRTSQKSMMATKSSTVIPPETSKDFKEVFQDSEALVQTRQTHMREVAEISEMIANGLGLNADFAYLIGLMHDIGHTWNGHSGERILSAIARLNNCGYIVHSAMGAYILERENIVNNAMIEIKEFNPSAKENEIREFIRYVIDGVVSHNGEGTIGKIIPKDKNAQQMAEEIKKCFTQKSYDKKIMPATMEGAIIRYADIIAYTRSDILDGFRLKDNRGNKILKDFDDDYLAIVGTLLAKKNNHTKILNIENKFLLELYGLSKKINQIKKEDNTINPADRIELERLQKEREIIEKKYQEFVSAKVEYARTYVNSIKPESERKTRVTQMMQNVFIMDLIETSKNKEYITMSPLIRRTFFGLRDLNIRKIVPFTRRAFEAEELPIAAEGLVNMFTELLIDTGVAYDSIPESVRNTIKPIKTKEEQSEKEKEINKNTKLKFERKICHYYRKQNPKKMKYMYKNVVDAMKDITKHDIEIAIGKEKYDGELKELYERIKISPIKRKIGEMGKNSDTITELDKEVLLQQLLEDRLQDIERAVASKMAIEYIGGMTDNTILSALIEKNLISRQQLIEGYGREEAEKQTIDSGVKALQKVFSDNEAMIYPDDREDDEISL